MTLTRWKVFILAVGMTAALGSLWRVEAAGSTRFKSASGRYEVFFEPVTERTLRLYQPRSGEPSNQKPQYLVYFYVAGSSDSISNDWYTDIDPPKSPVDIFASMLWSPDEDYVVLTHGQNAKPPDSHRWMISLHGPSETGFEGNHLHWIDRYRLVSDINTKKIPGGIQMIDAKRDQGDLVVSPIPGFGYQIAAVSGHRITVKEFLNHWQDDRDKTSWEAFDPACFEVDLDTMKKHSVPCPVAATSPTPPFPAP